MPRCCSCNSSGRCLRCACVQGGRNCGNCVPSNHDRCANQPQNGTRSQTVRTNDPRPQLLETNHAAREADGALSPSHAGVHTADFPSTPAWVTPGPASLGNLVVEQEPQSTPSTPSRIHELINTYRGDAELFVDSETLYSREGTTQGDSLAMAFYALATVPLIKACKVSDLAGEAWFADDATGSGRLTALHTWWDKLTAFGPNFGYHPSGDKTWLVVSESLKDAATGVFEGTSVQVTTQGRKHLGAALGSRPFVEQCVSQQVKEWTADLEQLSIIARSHPQAAYCAYSHGLKGRWLYLAWTVPNIGNLLQTLEDTLRQRFIPALTGRPAPSDTERELLALPARIGGLGIANPAATAEREHQASMQLSSPLVMLITRGKLT